MGTRGDRLSVACQALANLSASQAGPRISQAWLLHTYLCQWLEVPTPSGQLHLLCASGHATSPLLGR